MYCGPHPGQGFGFAAFVCGFVSHFFSLCPVKSMLYHLLIDEDTDNLISKHTYNTTEIR